MPCAPAETPASLLKTNFSVLSCTAAKGVDFTFQNLTNIEIVAAYRPTVTFNLLRDNVVENPPETFSLRLELSRGILVPTIYIRDTITIAINDGVPGQLFHTIIQINFYLVGMGNHTQSHTHKRE